MEDRSDKSESRKASRDGRLFTSFKIYRYASPIVLILSLATTFILWSRYDSSLQARAQLVFSEKTEEISEHIIQRMQDLEQVLLGATGLLAVDENVSRDEWRRYVVSQRLSEKYPGILGVGFSKWLYPEQVAANIQTIRAEGFPDYFIHPAGERPVYTAIVYLEPFDWRNLRAFGYDMFSEKVRRKAMELAKDSGKTALTGKIILLQETDVDVQNGMLMYVPVYHQEMPKVTRENRQKAILGFAYSPIRLKDLMLATFGEMPRTIAFEFSTPEGGQSDSLLFSSLAADNIGLAKDYQPDFTKVMTFDVYGRTWQLSFQSLPAFDLQFNRSSSLPSLLGGVLVSCLLALLTALLAAGRTRAIQAAKVIAENELRYRSLFELGADGVVIIDPETERFLDFNEQACRQLGYSRDEFRQLKISDIDLLEPTTEITDRIQNVVKQGAGEFETLQQTKDGEVRNVHIKAQYLDIGSRFIYCCIWRDITLQKKEEIILQKRLHLYEFSMTHSLDELLIETLDILEELTGSLIGFFHFVKDDQHTLTLRAWSTRTSQVFCKVEGIGSHYDIDKAGVWVDCVHQRQAVIHNDYAALPHKKGLPPGHAPVIRELAVPIFRAEKIVGILGLGNKPSNYDEGDVALVTRFAALAWDIADRKLIQQALRESDERFAVAFNNAPIMITISTLDDGTYLDVNQRFLEISEFSREEIIGESVGEIGWLKESDRSELLEKMQSDGKVQEHEITLHTKSAKAVLCKYWGEIVTVAERQCLLLIALDVTEHRQIERQYTQSQKMDALGTMVGGIAHNFNNNLAIILGNLELVKHKTDSDSKIGKYITNAHIATLRSTELVSNIMAYSHQGTYERRTIRVMQVIDETLKLVKVTMPTSIELQCLATTDVLGATIRANSNRLQEILINLINNAIHAMEEKGILTVSLNKVVRDGTDGPPHLGSFACISVQDTGCGMDTDTLNKIFDPFYTTKEVDKGTGLGLSTVKGIVEQHGGQIMVESAPGHGTKFELFFPLVELVESEQTKGDMGLLPGTEKILYVDDDVLLAETVEMMLSAMGYQVTAETSSVYALERIKQDPTSFDLVITDQTMPRLTGLELTWELKKICPELPVILFTGYNSVISKGDADQLGIKTILRKPLVLSEFLKAIRKVLDGEDG